MATNTQLTKLMAATTGYSISLGKDCGFVNVLAKADCWVKVVSSHNGDSITAPVATPAPAAGATATWIHLANSGEGHTVDISKGFQSTAPDLTADRMTDVLVWGVAAGELLINAR